MRIIDDIILFFDNLSMQLAWIVRRPKRNDDPRYKELQNRDELVVLNDKQWEQFMNLPTEPTPELVELFRKYKDERTQRP